MGLLARIRTCRWVMNGECIMNGEWIILDNGLDMIRNDYNGLFFSNG